MSPLILETHELQEVEAEKATSPADANILQGFRGVVLGLQQLQQQIHFTMDMQGLAAFPHKLLAVDAAENRRRIESLSLQQTVHTVVAWVRRRLRCPAGNILELQPFEVCESFGALGERFVCCM